MPDARIIEGAVELEAPLETAWRILTDFGDYGRWNPFVVRVDAPRRPGEGSVLRLHTRLPGGQRARAHDQITSWHPPTRGRALFVYQLVGPMSAGLHVERVQELIAIDDYHCRYETRESFSGLMRPLLPFAQLEEATHRQSDAFKWAVEGAFVQTTDGSFYPESLAPVIID